jgi:hypothetical protein
LLLSENPSFTPQDLKRIIMGSVDKSAPLAHKVAAGGRINAFKALMQAQESKAGSKRSVATAAR